MQIYFWTSYSFFNWHVYSHVITTLSWLLLHSENESLSVMAIPLWPHGLYSPWNSPGQNTGVGSLSLGGLPKPRVKLGSPALQADSLPAEPQGKHKNTGVGSLSFSSGSSQPRSQTGFSCIAGRFFTNWAIRETLLLYSQSLNQTVKVLQKYFDCFWLFAFPYTF